MSIDSATLKQLTSSLAEYNGTVNNWVMLIAHGIQAIALAILGVFFLIEWAKLGQHFRDTQGTPVTIDAVGQIAMKYLGSVLLILLSPLIIDSILAITNYIGHLIATTGGLSNTKGPSSDGLFDMSRISNIHWYQKAVFSSIQFVYNFLDTALNFVVTVLVFLRFMTLCVFKTASPVMMAFNMSEDYKSISINYWKQVGAISLQSVVLIITMKLLPFFIAGDLAGSGSITFNQWTSVASVGILKLIAALLAIIGSQNLARKMVGV